MKNREERRAYERKIKKDKRASKCPNCGYKALFYSISIPDGLKEITEYDGTVGDIKTTEPKYTTAIKCEMCDSIIFSGPEVEKLVPPGIILPLDIEIFGYALRHPEEFTNEKEEIIEANFENIEGEN